MRKFVSYVVVGLLAAVMATGSMAGITTVGSVDVAPSLLGDDFGYTSEIQLGREVGITGTYDVTFTAVFEESAYRNYFVSVGGILFDDINIGDSYTFRTTDVLNFGFGSIGQPGTANNYTNQTGYEANAAAFAVSWIDEDSLYIGFNDSYTGDKDYDDFVIRADFQEVPEPMPAALMGLGLLGMAATRMKRKAS
mgnify:CR=1 FL=1